MKIFNVLSGAVLSACIAATALFGWKISEKPKFAEQTEYRGIITVWQIDSFEGGTGSRRKFLLDAARGFERENSGVLVMVIAHTAESAARDMAQGVMPDLLSYGNGVEIKGAKELREKDFTAGGGVDGKTFALPWCRGGYCIITNPKLAPDISNMDSLLVSQGDYTQPLAALALEGLSVDKIEVLPPMKAYVKFTEGKTAYFLGTQRDVNRLINRGADFNVYPLTEYNDLYQYFSLLSNNALKSVYAEKFVQYILSDGVQKNLYKISMFSPRITVDFENERLSAMQRAGDFKTVSAFTAPQELNRMQELSAAAALGDEEALFKIKNFLL